MSGNQELYRIGGVSYLLDKRVIQFIEKLKAEKDELDKEDTKKHKRIIQLNQQAVKREVEIIAQKARAEKAEAEFIGFDDFHPRALKLLRKRKNFLVVAEDEPYYFQVYELIRKCERQIDRWTEIDEAKFQKAKRDYYWRPIDWPEGKK